MLLYYSLYTWLPQARLWAANIIDFIPEAQTLFIVVQGVDTGKPEVVSMHKNKNKVIHKDLQHASF